VRILIFQAWYRALHRKIKALNLGVFDKEDEIWSNSREEQCDKSQLWFNNNAMSMMADWFLRQDATGHKQLFYKAFFLVAGRNLAQFRRHRMCRFTAECQVI
jgi:hypothetical protein